MSGRLRPGIKPAAYIRLAIAEPGRSVLRPYQQQKLVFKMRTRVSPCSFFADNGCSLPVCKSSEPAFFSR